MKKRKVWRVLLSVLLGLTVLFIWSNSLRGREASSEQSGRVLQFLQGILDGLGISLTQSGAFHGILPFGGAGGAVRLRGHRREPSPCVGYVLRDRRRGVFG